MDMTELERAVYLSFVDRSFRDIADLDYVAARGLYRRSLLPPFLTAAGQAVEKYLKAILLYNDIPALGIGHDLEKALSRLEDINGIAVVLPKAVRTSILRLNKEVGNRYFELPMHVDGNVLPGLDETVWHLRRYARWFRPTATGVPYCLPIPRPEDARAFRVHGGRIEKILATPGSARSDLIWKNLYYGARRKKAVRLELHFEVANPTHSLNPWIFPLLATRVDFSKETKAWFKEHAAERAPGQVTKSRTPSEPGAKTDR